MSYYCWGNIQNCHSCQTSWGPHIGKWLLLFLFQQPSSGLGNHPLPTAHQFRTEPGFTAHFPWVLWTDHLTCISVHCCPISNYLTQKKSQKIRHKIQNWASLQHRPTLQAKPVPLQPLLLPPPSSSPGASPFPSLDLVLEMKSVPVSTHLEL